MKSLKTILQLVRDTLHQFVRFFHIGFRMWIVWGIGVAFSKSGGWEIDSDYKWMAMLIQWKLYIGPLIVVGNIPYRFKRCQYKPNPNVQTEPRLGGDSLEPIVGRPSDLSETK